MFFLFKHIFVAIFIVGVSPPVVLDSGSATSRTGEVSAVKQIMPINVSSSDIFWLNDTIEAFRTCPQYGSSTEENYVTIIGRNFIDTKTNYCKWRSCFSSNTADQTPISPRRCLNNVKKVTGEDLPVAGNVSQEFFITRARFISPTRMECRAPEYIFPSEPYYYPLTVPATGSSPTVINACANVYYQGILKNQVMRSIDGQSGNYSFIRLCDTTGGISCGSGCNCLLGELASTGLQQFEYLTSLTFPCQRSEIIGGTCSNKPEPGYMFNPCFTNEALIEVSNDGSKYSGGDNLRGLGSFRLIIFNPIIIDYIMLCSNMPFYSTHVIEF